MRIGLILLGVAVAAAPAAAEKRLKRHTPGVQEDEINTKAEVEPSVAAGALLPYSVAARHERLGMLLGGYGGADLSKRAPVMVGTLDATLIDRVTLRASMVNVGMSNLLRPNVGLLFDVARSESSGVDVAVGGDYQVVGWTGVPTLMTRSALGGDVGALRLNADAGFGLGLQKQERYGELGVAGVTEVAQKLYVGVDSRARVNLQRSTDPMMEEGQPDWDVQAGPVATLAYGRMAFTASAGVSAWKQLTHENAKVGPVGALGLHAAF